MPATGHEFPLGAQGNISHVPHLHVSHPETDKIIRGEHPETEKPIRSEEVFSHPDTNRKNAILK